MTTTPQDEYATGRLRHRTTAPQDDYATGRLRHRTTTPQDDYATGRLHDRTTTPQDVYATGRLRHRTTTPQDDYATGLRHRSQDDYATARRRAQAASSPRVTRTLVGVELEVLIVPEEAAPLLVHRVVRLVTLRPQQLQASAAKVYTSRGCTCHICTISYVD